MNRKLLTFLAGASVLAVGLGVYFYTPPKPVVSDLRRLAAKAERRDIESAVVASGFVRPIISSEIKAEVSGKVLQLPVIDGQRVKQGDLLAELDPTIARADREEAARNLQLQRLNLEKLARDRTRAEALRAREFVSAKEAEDAITAHEVAKLQLEVAQSRLDKAEENLRRTSIRAPHDGVVSDLGVLVGQIVVSAQSINSGTPLMKVSAIDTLRVDINLNEFDATRLEVGRDALLSFDSLPGVRRPGRISFLAAFGVADAKDKEVRVFPCQIAFESGEGVRPGISSNARIQLAVAKAAIAVPVSAVFVDGDERHLFVQQGDGKWERRAVKIGLSDSGWSEVLQGLAEGETVSLVRPAGQR